MNISYTPGDLTRLPGRHYDPSARNLRELFVSESIDIDDFLKKNAFSFPRTHLDRYQNQVNSYATASLVIEEFWDFVKETSVTVIMAELARRHASGSHTERVAAFSVSCGAVLDMFRNKFSEMEKSRRDAENRTHADNLRICFYAVARMRHRHLKGLPFPSQRDLVVLVTRMAEVLPRVFERDVGRPITREEVFELLRHPSLLRFFVELARNDRCSTYPLFALLETTGKPDLKNPRGTFRAEHFVIHEQDGERSIRLHPETAHWYRKRHERAEARQKRRGKPPRSVLGCPALYTGKFREMHEWTIALLEPWIE